MCYTIRFSSIYVPSFSPSNNTCNLLNNCLVDKQHEEYCTVDDLPTLIICSPKTEYGESPARCTWIRVCNLIKHSLDNKMNQSEGLLQEGNQS